MIHYVAHSVAVARDHPGNVMVGFPLVHEDQRGALLVGPHRAGYVQAGSRHDETVDLPSEHAGGHRTFTGGVVVGVRQDQRVSGATELVFDPPDDRRKEGVREIRDEHADGMRLPGSQSPCQWIRPVLEILCRLEQALDCLGTEQVSVRLAKSTGCRRRINACAGRHVPQGHAMHGLIVPPHRCRNLKVVFEFRCLV